LLGGEKLLGDAAGEVKRRRSKLARELRRVPFGTSALTLGPRRLLRRLRPLELTTKALAAPPIAIGLKGGALRRALLTSRRLLAETTEARHTAAKVRERGAKGALLPRERAAFDARSTLDALEVSLSRASVA
jgi:hypothetical protein